MSQWHKQVGTSSELSELQKIGLTFSSLAIHAYHHISFHQNQLLINISHSNRYLHQRWTMERGVENMDQSKLEELKRIIELTGKEVKEDPHNDAYGWNIKKWVDLWFGYNKNIHLKDSNDLALFVEIQGYIGTIEPYLEKVDTESITAGDVIELGILYRYESTRDRKERPKDPQISLLMRLDESKDAEAIVDDLMSFFEKYR